MKSMNNSRKLLLTLAKVAIIIATLLWLVLVFFVKDDATISNILKFTIWVFYITGLSIIISFYFGFIIFDPRDYTLNRTKGDIIMKLRLRALLFNNLSVIILFFILIVIITSFYHLISPLNPKNIENAQIVMSVTLSAVTVSLIFLVHIAFRVFKYVLRVAAFYNARADAIEFNTMDSTISLEKLMELFTPSNYDISDLSSNSSIPAIDKPFIAAMSPEPVQESKEIKRVNSIMIQKGIEKDS